MKSAAAGSSAARCSCKCCALSQVFLRLFLRWLFCGGPSAGNACTGNSASTESGAGPAGRYQPPAVPAPPSRALHRRIHSGAGRPAAPGRRDRGKRQNPDSRQSSARDRRSAGPTIRPAMAAAIDRPVQRDAAPGLVRGKRLHHVAMRIEPVGFGDFAPQAAEAGHRARADQAGELVGAEREAAFMIHLPHEAQRQPRVSAVTRRAGPAVPCAGDRRRRCFDRWRRRFISDRLDMRRGSGGRQMGFALGRLRGDGFGRGRRLGEGVEQLQCGRDFICRCRRFVFGGSVLR